MHPPSDSRYWSFSVNVVFLLPLLLLPWNPSAAVSALCLTNQSATLLRFKQGLSLQPPERLVSWHNGFDCCKWEGVTCDDATGFVVGLQLNGATFGAPDGELLVTPSRIDPSLFRLLRLRLLDLSNNLFSGPIPSRLVELRELAHLNLSNAGFSGQIPAELSQMTWLVSLDLSVPFPSFSSESSLELQNLASLLKNLNRLRTLRLDGVNISMNGAACGSVISSALPNLHTLSLSNCFISGPMNESILHLSSLSYLDLSGNNLSSIPEFFANLTKLRFLGLGSSSLRGTIPPGIFRLPQLLILNISSNRNLQGNFPDTIPLSSKIQVLSLYSTGLSGSIPDSVGNLSELRVIRMSDCNFTGSMPLSLSKLTRLQILDLSKNSLSGLIPPLSVSTITEITVGWNNLMGPIPNSFAELDGLTTLNLNNNLLTSSIPTGLLNLVSLKTVVLSHNNLTGSLSQFTNPSSLVESLDLSNNMLQGEIPSTMASLLHLKSIELSKNNFSGDIDIYPFMTLKNLSILRLSYNKLTVAETSPRRRSHEATQLRTLFLSSCNISRFPEWIQELGNLSSLALADNNISGLVPSWLWRASTELTYLNLSGNMLTGFEHPFDVSIRTSSVMLLDLRNNLLAGDLPPFPPTAFLLDFSNNRFKSPIHSCNDSRILAYLSISNNNITGTVPECLCNSMTLFALDLSINSLVGSIPYCLTNSSSLSAMHLGKNQLSGSIPDGFGTHCKLKTLKLNDNRLSGGLPTSLSNCRALEVLDLSNNELTGEFPSWLGGLSQLRVLSLRSNHLYGSVVPPPYEKPFPALQIIDVSSNNLSGTLQPGLFRILSGMMKTEPYGRKAKGVEIFNNVYYTVSITVISKGLQMDGIMLDLMTSIDMSNNHFSGEIPDDIGILLGLVLLNMSNNDLVGPIPLPLANLVRLESLDLSHNRLSGNIPVTLSRLTFLSVLNLAFNNLQGRIPEGNQFSTFEAPCFEGNPGLCGPPLTRACTDTSLPNITTSIRKADFGPLFIATELGFVGGLASFLMPFFLVRRVRWWWYGLIDKITVLVLRKLYLHSYTTFFS